MYRSLEYIIDNTVRTVLSMNTSSLHHVLLALQ